MGPASGLRQRCTQSAKSPLARTPLRAALCDFRCAMHALRALRPPPTAHRPPPAVLHFLSLSPQLSFLLSLHSVFYLYLTSLFCPLNYPLGSAPFSPANAHERLRISCIGRRNELISDASDSQLAHVLDRNGWHIDGGRPVPEMEEHPQPRLSLKIGYFLTDTTIENSGCALLWWP